MCVEQAATPGQKRAETCFLFASWTQSVLADESKDHSEVKSE